jgi:hemerythrin superfamily protein
LIAAEEVMMAADVVTLITRDHRTFERLFAQVKAGGDGVPALLGKIAAMLAAHSRAEEERVYPALARAEPDETGEVQHGTQEHHEAERLLQQAIAAGPGSSAFDRQFDEFVQAVTHHIEEEESEILPSLRSAVGPAELERLGQEFADRRQQELFALGAGDADVLPPGPEATVPELQEEARRLDIEGRSTMNKDELLRAIAERS